MKVRLIASIAAIAGVSILETFIHIDDVPVVQAMWQLLILLGIAVTGVLLALADLYFHSGTYMNDLAGQFLALLAGFVLATVITVAGPFIPVPAHRLAGADAAARPGRAA